MNTEKASKPRELAQIGKYYYGYTEIDLVYYICIQQMGDRGWLVKPEKFFNKESLVAEVKRTEKEHYDKLKNNKT